MNWDIYYLYEYAHSFMLHGDGDIFLVYFENESDRFCYAVMQRDISESDSFKGLIESRRYYDWETPYGYGGPLTDRSISLDSQQLFEKEITDYCNANNIVAQFVRFHPLLENHTILPAVIEARYLRDTIYIDTCSLDGIMQNMDSKNRNMVRKAIKSGVSIVKREIEEFEDFVPMYTQTMEKNGADPYFFFAREYFVSLADMQENAFILYAMFEGHPISSAIIFCNDKYMHYHLSGSYTDFRKYSPSNLLLYEAACIANQRGIQQFHLGGGMAPDDSLFSFKKQFNKQGRAPFVVGRTIFDRKAYEKLLQIRKTADPMFDTGNGFMIQYRR